MARSLCWVIDNYEFRECENPAREFRLPVSLHGHTYHSEERLGRMNQVMKLPVLNIINELFQGMFRAQAHDDLDYDDLHYCPPISPTDVYDLELSTLKPLGFDKLLFAVTDHDKIAGSHEFIDKRPEMAELTTISEELSLWYGDQVIHMGIHGIPKSNSEDIHKTIQEYRFKHEHGAIFEMLHHYGCLVIMNHPLWKLKLRGDFNNALTDFLRRFSWAIDAYEFNGLRTKEENSLVIDMARRFQKPLIGGGDRHTPLPGLVFSASRDARTFKEYIQEVKGGYGIVLGNWDYFIPHGWKLFIRIMQYLQKYREIIYFKKMPLSTYPIPDRIFPDFFADMSRSLTRILSKFNLVR